MRVVLAAPSRSPALVHLKALAGASSLSAEFPQVERTEAYQIHHVPPLLEFPEHNRRRTDALAGRSFDLPMSERTRPRDNRRGLVLLEAVSKPAAECSRTALIAGCQRSNTRFCAFGLSEEPLKAGPYRVSKRTLRSSRSSCERGNGGALGGPCRATCCWAKSALHASAFCGAMGSKPLSQDPPVTGFRRILSKRSDASLKMGVTGTAQAQNGRDCH